ncbi:MAG TPA: acyl-CoA dehydrogenase [Deltaproteobacteria bacterium]|nr:acyl-CoA dehydrogenase [Deltaproteobacteria bacterium]HPR56526.1 acyl-CoA dehydrogenase [Deltaproteobacteria bacterium]HXK48064.1 acyl-CoA dehydrogenase [Deltaproteobacteria bacterium]
MAQSPLVDMRDLYFVLFEMLQVDKLCAFPRYGILDRDLMGDTISLAERISLGEWYPIDGKADEDGLSFDPSAGTVTVPSYVRGPYRTMVDAGFIAVSDRDDPRGLPMSVSIACKELFCSASAALAFLTLLTGSAAGLIRRFGTTEQKDLYLEKMLTGTWSGTMCLTEPGAGSDVGRVATRAVALPDGTYRISGRKMFISAGEHDLTRNIIHLVLARTEDAPPGTKGLSLFIVPKFLVGTDGSLGRRNGVFCTGIEKKMGFHAGPTCALSFGDDDPCMGYLLGGIGQGMRIMFEMMNEERIFCGLQGLASSSAAYHHALTYARERLQGVHYSRILDPTAPAVPIIEHPDVKRMLLWMKAYVDGMRMFTYYLAWNIDMGELYDGDAARQARAMVDLLTPLCKAGNTDTVWLVTAEAMQVFGGYGFCRDYPVERLARSCKALSIVEGTNGIQSMDVVLRKILLNPDRYNYSFFRSCVMKTVESALHKVDSPCVDIVAEGMEKMDEVISVLNGHLISGRMEDLLMLTTPVQQAMFMLVLAWMHLWSLTLTLHRLEDFTRCKEPGSIVKEDGEAAFYHGKVMASRFFLLSEFPKFFGRTRAILGA